MDPTECWGWSWTPGPSAQSTDTLLDVLDVLGALGVLGVLGVPLSNIGTAGALRRVLRSVGLTGYYRWFSHIGSKYVSQDRSVRKHLYTSHYLGVL
ncbi:hypothetical protein SAMD00023353_1001800 [Rosellinia necatrix]|uniref:Uncharacterized protein n=1 Tax=Rosellinia necatrix TaxID=77044 RepID=A0A1S8A6D0_ROSNE|nr:hypothetical protein SAMD00023353_1001800 [Rosellinia necatrix]